MSGFTDGIMDGEWPVRECAAMMGARLANQAEQIGRLMCRVEQLEREKEALRESRDHWLDVAAKVVGTLDGMTRASRETPAFPLNAIKHSL